MEEHEVTLGVEFGSLLLKIEDALFRLQIWDTAGQESFKSLTKIFYRGAHAVLICYDVGNQQSFQSLDYWYSEVKQNCESDVIPVLIATQCDKPTSQREVTFEEGDTFAKDKGDIEFFIETSAKTGHNVQDTFLTIARVLYLKNKEKIDKAKSLKAERAMRRRLRRLERRPESKC